MYLLTVDNKEEADTLLLVLESQDIDAFWLERNNCSYDIFLDDSEESKISFAKETISLFYTENYSNKSIAALSSEQPLVLTQNALFSVSLFVLLLCTIHASTIFHNNHREVVLKYGSSALFVLQGQYYRVITALMLHSDIEHLAGNVVGMLSLGIPLCSIIGAARGMFLIVLSGGVGNLLNVWLYRSSHLSIGASTAVMGAVGNLVAFQIIKRKRQFKPIGQYRQIPPIFILACGAAFVGMMSGGQNTDVSAHIFGFIAGLIFGFLGRLSYKYHPKRPVT
ncbi:MAG: rhomboid family intramembrane serine protease [Desulfamplus sp.]|nr:rhomboid family intramembrane serine protease [Desulfamplus sp.]